MTKRKMSLSEARSWCVLAYVVAAAAGAATWIFAPIASHFWRMAAADVVATCVIFGFSLGLYFIGAMILMTILLFNSLRQPLVIWLAIQHAQQHQQRNG